MNETMQDSGLSVEAETGFNPAFPNLKPFDSASAREAGKKGARIRLENKAKAEAEAVLEREQAKKDKEQLQVLLQAQIHAQIEERARAEQERMTPDEIYRLKRLDRVRRQMAMIDRLIESETMPDALSKLATASAKLADQERLLAGRPTPGSNKPVAKRAKPEASFEPE